MKQLGANGIESFLADTGRIYLCGNLQRDPGIEYIKTEAYEMGISDYPEYTSMLPHIHSFNNEYSYVLEGEIKVLLLSTGREYLFGKGDFFVIEPGEPHAMKCVSGTRTVFSKVPGGNDKLMVEESEAIKAWGSSWHASYDPNAAL